MAILLLSNDAATVLTAPTPASGSGSTTFTIASATNFPSPSSGQAYYATLIAASDPTIKERVLITAMSGTTATAIRGQDGTTALNWNANDQFQMRVNAGSIRQMVQQDQLQIGTYGGATAGGSANALTATVASLLVALPDRFPLVVTAGAANTAAATLNLTLGSTVTGAISIVKGNGTALAAGDIPGAGYPISLNYSVTLGAWVMQNPAGGITPGGMLTPRAMANFNSGTLVWGNNITNWTRTGTGTYTFNFIAALSDNEWGITVGSSGQGLAYASGQATGGGTINFYNTDNNTATDGAGLVVFWR